MRVKIWLLRQLTGPSACTTLGVGLKKLSRVGKGIPDMYIVFRFGAKIAIFRATNGVAS